MNANTNHSNGPHVELAMNGRLGLASGDLLRTTRSEMRKVMKQAGGDRAKAVQLGIARLSKERHITGKDAKRLTAIANRVFTSDNAVMKSSDRDAIESIYYELAGDSEASPIAIAIAGGTLGALSLPVPAGKAAALPTHPGAGQVGGALIGSIVGGLVGGFGGPLGGAVGAGLGAGIGAAVGSCFD